MNTPFDILVAGEINPDLVLSGDDVFGRFMLDEMQKRNVDVSHVIVRQAGKTGLSVILNREADRAILTHLGLIPTLQ